MWEFYALLPATEYYENLIKFQMSKVIVIKKTLHLVCWKYFRSQSNNLSSLDALKSSSEVMKSNI